MRSAIPIILAVAVLLPATATAQMDVVEQHVAVDVTGELHVEIDATAEITEASDLLYFPTFLSDVVELTVDGESVTYAPHPDYPDYLLVVTLPAVAEVGDTLAVRVVTHGRPACSRGASPGTVWCWHDERETTLPTGGWYVTNPLESDPFTGTVEVRAPASFVVRAAQNGPTGVEEEGDVTRTRFAIERPTTNVGLYAGEAEVMTGEGFPFDVIYHEDRDDAGAVARMADLGAELYPLYGELFGVLPTEHAQVVLVPRNFGAGGLGLMGSPFIAEYVVGEYDFLLVQGTAHELAHSWWAGVASAPNQVEAPFLQEGFAEYSAWLGLGRLYGEETRIAGNRMNATFYMYRRPDGADVAILDPDAYAHPAYLHASYHKGSQVLRMLEARVGEEAFLDALRGLVARGANGLSVAALREEIERASGEDVGAFLDQWLRATGYPVLTVGPERLDLDGTYDLRVTVRETYSDGRSIDSTVELGAAGVDLTSDSGAVLREVDPAWTFAREVRPVVEGDVTLDGAVDAADLIAVALRGGSYLPEERRRDGGYDPLFDLDGDRRVDEADVRRAFDLGR